MSTAMVQILEYCGRVVDARRDEVKTYLLAIDGEYKTKYRKPDFSYLPKAWRDKYLVASFDIGSAQTWKDFFEKCALHLETEQPFRTAATNIDRPAHLHNLSAPAPEPRKVERYSNNSNSSNNSNLLSPEPFSTNKTITPASELALLPSPIRAIVEELFSEPLERALSLEFEIRGYLALLNEEVQRVPTIDIPVATAIAEGSLSLIEYLGQHGAPSVEHFRMLQAAIRYFTVSDDATSDFEEGGFDDDAAVFNAAARVLGRADLIIGNF